LVHAGHSVSVLVRPDTNAKLLDGLDLTQHRGELDDERALDLLLDGAEGLCHVAGAAGRFYDDAQAYEQVNVALSGRVFAAARRAGVRRAVYTGSIAIPSRATSEYARSKFRGAYEARRAAGTKLDVLVVHPSGMIGARDLRPTPLGKAVIELAQGKLWAVLGGGSGYIDVDDAARGHLAALLHGDPSREYTLTAEFWPTHLLFCRLAEMLGVPRPRKLPEGLSLWSARLLDPLGRRFGFEPPITRFSSEYLLTPRAQVPDGDADRDALGLHYRPVLEAFRDAIEWFRSEGYLAKQ
jgi:dihydroflavonol-4-reductase